MSTPKKTMSMRLFSILLTLVMLAGVMPISATPAKAATDTYSSRKAPESIITYIEEANTDRIALKQGQAKFTWVEFHSNGTDRESFRVSKVTSKMKCELVNANIAKRIGYNSGNPTVTDEGQLVELKSKLKLSDMYSIPSSKPLPFDKRYKHDSDIFVGDIDNGTTRYLLSVEAYFNDTYYFDGAVFFI